MSNHQNSMRILNSLLMIKFNYFLHKFYANAFIQDIYVNFKVINKKKELIF